MAIAPKLIVMAGDPLDGLDFHGPFDTYDEAYDWAIYKLIGENWWIHPLHSPNDDGPSET